MAMKGGLMLIVMGLTILMVPGLMYNNLVNSGLGNTNTAMTCNSTLITCTFSTPVGCQAHPGYCSNLTNKTFAFLNACSPFTNILAANFIGFVQSFFTNCGSTTAQTNQNFVNSFNGNVTMNVCTATYGVHSLTTQKQWKVCSIAGSIFPTPQGLTAPVYITCLSWNGTRAFPNVDGHGRYINYCNFVDNSSPQVGYTFTGWLFGNTTDVTSIIGTNFATSNTGVAGGFAQVLNGNVLGFILSLLGAAILIILGLGLNGGIATANIGVNPQGSKLAQVFGVGLLLWGPLYTEFDTWFTSGILPAGFDGAIGIVSIGLIALYFFGLFELSQTAGLTQ